MSSVVYLNVRLEVDSLELLVMRSAISNEYGLAHSDNVERYHVEFLLIQLFSHFIYRVHIMNSDK